MPRRVAVLTGGSTPERHVALAGAAQVVAALRESGHDVTVVDTVEGPIPAANEAQVLGKGVGKEPPTAEEVADWSRRELGHRVADLPAIQQCDIVFLVLHGRQGEGGQLQALLDLAGVPFTGTDALGSALAMEKDTSKRLFRAAGVPTPDWFTWPASETEVHSLGFPVIVKPSRVGSTVGLTVVHDSDGIGAAVQTACHFDSSVLLEQRIQGREVTVGILGDRPLAVGEIIPRHEIFDYECKYVPGMSQEIFPADLSEDVTRRVQSLAMTAHRVLKLQDMSRVDFIVADGTPYCLEANTLPGLTQTSLLPQSALAAGIPFRELCEAICDLALQRRPEQRSAVRE